MELLENKKPRFKNRGLSCGPIGANGSNQVDLSLLTEISIKYFLFARLCTFLDVSSLKTPFSKWKMIIAKVSA
jgi:hypothetical protein